MPTTPRKTSTDTSTVAKITAETLPEGMSPAAIGLPIGDPTSTRCKVDGCTWGVFGSESVCWRHLPTKEKKS